MNASPLEFVIDALAQARSGHGLADAAPLADSLATLEEAYAVQQAVAARCWPFGLVAVQYWKTGAPSRQAAQTHARLPEAGIWRSPAHSGQAFAMRGIEAEIALRLAVPVDAQRAAALDRDGACRLVESMAVAIEVVDSRWREGLEAPALLKLADLQSHGALVLGPWVPFDAGHDWSAQRCRVQVGEAPSEEFVGTHSMQDPAWALAAWLRHATQDGQVLPAGSVVTTGTWCGLLQARPGDAVRASFDGVGEAEVRFEAAAQAAA